jgi:cadmium resistance protein CadD (predicted permease)
VYIPLFTGFDLTEKLAAVAVFAVMTALWLFLAGRFSALPVVEGFLRRYRSVLIPAVLILLGVFILLGGLQG